MQRQELVNVLNTWLQPDQFKDFGPNGLQVEGRESIQVVVTGVTASLALINAAIEAKADAIVVHHGLFWRGQTGTITGWMRQRLGRLIESNTNLLAYHLPLDAHPELGNNAQLAKHLGLQLESQCGDQNLLAIGRKAQGDWASAQDLAQHVTKALGRQVVLETGSQQGPIRKLAWCTGGAQSYFEAAISQGVDAFITGEISEPQAHYARECGVAFLACGHHATERYGVQRLAQAIATQFAIQTEYFELHNPI